jgi:hypothetical protein
MHIEPQAPPPELDPSVRKAIARAVESIPDSAPLWPEARRREPSELGDGAAWQATRPSGDAEPELAGFAAQSWEPAPARAAAADDSSAASWRASRTRDEHSPPAARPSGRRAAWLWALSALLLVLGGAAFWRLSATNTVDEQLARITELLPRIQLPPPERPAASVPPPTVAAAPAPAASASEAVAVAEAPAASATIATPPAAATPAAAAEPAASAPPAAAGDVMAEHRLPPPAAGVAPVQPAAAVATMAAKSPPARPAEAQATPPARTPQRSAARGGARPDGALPPRRLSATDPREQCGGRRDFALLYCLRAQCKKPQYEASEQCRTLRRGGELR